MSGYDENVSDEALQRAIAAACLEEGAADELAHDPSGFLRSHGVAEADILALGDDARRFALYRTLVRNNLTGVSESLLSATRARIGPRFDRDLAAFLGERGPASPYLRDVPFEFLDWILPRWEIDPAVPRWAGDSARYELALFAVGAAPHVTDPPTLRDLALDRPVAFSGSVRLLELGWTVHRGDADPEARPVHLLVHRDVEWIVRVLELSPLAHSITAELLGGAALQQAMLAGCTKMGQALDDASLAAIARLLADYGTRGVILGAVP
ncbi:hypothetical protein BH09MYX1_BH09MYX1_58760 [soil metagenome]